MTYRPQFSATVKRGKKANRISVHTARAMRAAKGAEIPPQVLVPTRGTPVVLCISLGLDDADELDRDATERHMTRSAYVRHLIWGGK